MALRTARHALFACALLAAAVLAGCSTGREGGAGREGKPEEVGKVQYNVYITRELNLKDAEDSGYYQGPEAPPGFSYYGVFLQACNPAHASSSPLRPAATDFKIVDTNGDSFRPMTLPTSNIWAYHARSLKQRACIPRAGSLAASGPTSGAMLLFKIPVPALEDRPFDLVIRAPDGQQGKIELDI